MNAPLRRISVSMLVLFGLLFANLNWVQFVQNDFYRNHPRNKRVQLQEYQRQRGDIVVDQQRVALSQDTGGRLRFQRFYPLGAEYAHVVGFKSLELGKTGIEATDDRVLSGEADELFVRRVSDIVTGRRPVGGNVLLTLSRRTQDTAFKGLGNRKGAVVALDPKTGKLLALASSPSFNPQPLASHSVNEAKRTWDAYLADPNEPLINRGLNKNYNPGSTFKVIVSAAALSEGGYDPNTMVPAGVSYRPMPPSSYVMTNSDGGDCGGPQITLIRALTVSCNTAFGQLGVKLGRDKIAETARAFGFYDDSLRVPLKVDTSVTGPMNDRNLLAQSCIGQLEVRMTPIENALVAATVANNGVMMQPYLVDETQGPDLSTLRKTQPEELRKPMSSEAAARLREMMVSVVENGTGRGAKLDIGGVTVGGKTGTAENAEGENDHGWFIGFAMKDGEPIVAVAVFLERAGKGGSRKASELAGGVMRTALAERGIR